jgi:hypothetical protein
MIRKLQFLIWPAYLVVLFTAAASTLVVEVSAHAGHNHQQYSPTPVAIDVHCSATKQVITMSITDTTFTPNRVTAHLCDKVIFHNATKGPIDVAMGPHEHHLAYPGLSAALIETGADRSLQLVSKGTFPLHEHLKDVATGTLIVLP